MTTTTTHRYVEIAESQIPDGVRFDVPGRNQGQIVEIAYGGFSRTGHDEGDPYQRIIDRSLGPQATYYRLVQPRYAVIPAAPYAWQTDDVVPVLALHASEKQALRDARDREATHAQLTDFWASRGKSSPHIAYRVVLADDTAKTVRLSEIG